MFLIKLYFAHKVIILWKVLPPKYKVDLAVFDEAHRTAIGRRKDKDNFSYALYDKYIYKKKTIHDSYKTTLT